MSHNAHDNSLWSRAGWLFADMLLVVAALFLASGSVVPGMEITPTKTPEPAVRRSDDPSTQVTDTPTPVPPTDTPTSVPPTDTPTPPPPTNTPIVITPTHSPTPVPPTDTPTPPTPADTPTPLPIACNRKVDAHFMEIELENFGADDLLTKPIGSRAYQRAEAEVRAQFRKKIGALLPERELNETYNTIKIAFGLTFGAAPGDNLPRGAQLARVVNGILMTEIPAQDAAFDNYHYVQEKQDFVYLKIYLLVEEC
jgi:hypothetical protein